MKQFIMGAKLTMQDQASKGIVAAEQATKKLASSVGAANSALNRYAAQTDRAKAATKQFKSEGDSAASKSRSWANGNSKLSSSFSTLKSGIVAAAGALGLWKAKEWLIDSNANMETYRNTLNVVMKDSNKAAATLDWASSFAAKTPFEIPGIVEATTKLTAYGMNAQKVLPITGDMASAMGKDLMQAVEAVADAQNGQLERMMEFSITKKMIVDQAKKLKMPDVINNQGQITNTKAFNASLFSLMEDRFKGAMEAQSTTWEGMISNAKDFIGTMGRTLGKPVFDRLKIQLERIMKWAQGIQASGVFDKWAANIGTTLDKVGAYFSKFVNEDHFKSMSLAEKFIFVLKDMLTKASNFMKGPGGTQVKEIFRMGTTTMIEVLSGAVNELLPIATMLGTQIGAAIVTGIGQALGNKIKEPMRDMENRYTAAAKDVQKNPSKLIDPKYSSFGLTKQLLPGIVDYFKGAFSADTKTKAGKVGQNANGTRNWRGGWSWVGERGPELMQLPKGTNIASNYESRQMVEPKLERQQISNPAGNGRASNYENRQMVNPAGSGRASSSKGGLSIGGNFIDKIVIEGGTKDPQQIADVVIDRLHELMRQAKEISGSADMGALLA